VAVEVPLPISDKGSYEMYRRRRLWLPCTALHSSYMHLSLVHSAVNFTCISAVAALT